MTKQTFLEIAICIDISKFSCNSKRLVKHSLIKENNNNNKPYKTKHSSCNL